MTEIMLGKIKQSLAQEAERRRAEMRRELQRQLSEILDRRGAGVEEIHRRTGLSLRQISRLLVSPHSPDDATLEDLFTLLAEYDLRIEVKEAE